MKFRIVTKQFGYPMYAAPCDPAWTDRADEAYIYDDRDNPEITLAYWRDYARHCELDPQYVRVEMI